MNSSAMNSHLYNDSYFSLCAIFTRKIKWKFFVSMIILVIIISILLISKSQRIHSLMISPRRQLSSITQQQAISICNRTFYHLHPIAFNNDRLIIVVTPTYKRFTRIPDMIRLVVLISSIFILIYESCL